MRSALVTTLQLHRDPEVEYVAVLLFHCHFLSTPYHAVLLKLMSRVLFIMDIYRVTCAYSLSVFFFYCMLTLRGDFLLFLTGQEEIEAMCRMLAECLAHVEKEKEEFFGK